MKTNRLKSSLFSSFWWLTGLGLLFSCHEYPPSDLAGSALIPLPVSMESTGNYFQLRHDIKIYVEEGNEAVADAGEYLASLLYPATRFDLKVESTPRPPVKGHIYLHLDVEDASLGDEGYLLEITDSYIELAAREPAGLIMGIATLRQLLPDDIESDSLRDIAWMIPTGMIRDFPEYKFRSAMLDVARHFIQPEDLLRFIDYMAMYKFNRLHLHLSDDQGWRIEILSWPRLTEYGSTTQVGGGEGGFYTQEEYRKIVEYAAQRNIMVIPEIDMPGHTNAALASYPELTCDGVAPDLYTGIEVGFSTLCTTKENVYKFVDDVVRELAAITPGDYFHIGGDESLITPLEEYISFIDRVQKIVESHGKKVIGWDEISHASLIPHSLVQYWADVENAQRAIAQGAKVIMAPARKAYMDMQYDSTSRIGLHWAAYIEVDEAYQWDPAELEPGISREDIIGIEAALWTETVADLKDIEYLIFPRMPGYAEIGWSPSEKQDWNTYKDRLIRHLRRLDLMGIGYYQSPVLAE